MSRFLSRAGSARRVRLLLGGALLIGYGSFVAVVAVWPTPVDGAHGAAVGGLLARLHEAGVPPFFDYAWLEFCANVAFFVPLGAAVALLVPWPRWAAAVALTAAVSGSIELAQLVFLPERFASWLDVVANTAGGAIGVGVVFACRGWVRRAARRRLATPADGVAAAREAHR